MGVIGDWCCLMERPWTTPLEHRHLRSCWASATSRQNAAFNNHAIGDCCCLMERPWTIPLERRHLRSCWWAALAGALLCSELHLHDLIYKKIEPITSMAVPWPLIGIVQP